MARLILSEMEKAKAQTDLGWRQLCDGVPYSTLMRWRAGHRAGLLLVQPPGPRKTQSLDWTVIHREVAQLQNGRRRTRGTTELCRRYRSAASRRQIRQLAADATEYQGMWKLIPVSDLACHYRFVPLVALSEDGNQIAAYLDALFRQHGCPLFLKRDNGSPFNCQAVDEVLQRHGVLPLNSPPFYPRYNGAVEKSIGDFKRHLEQRCHRSPLIPAHFIAQVEAAVHELNHKPRRRFKGRTPCDLFHDPNRRLCLSRTARKKIFRLLLQQLLQTIGKTPARNHHEMSATWRLTVEAWLRCQGLISIRLKPKPNVSTNFPPNWSHN